MSKLKLSANHVMGLEDIQEKSMKTNGFSISVKPAREVEESYWDIRKYFPMSDATRYQSTLWNPDAPHQEGPVKNTEA